MVWIPATTEEPFIVSRLCQDIFILHQPRAQHMSALLTTCFIYWIYCNFSNFVQWTGVPRVPLVWIPAMGALMIFSLFPGTSGHFHPSSASSSAQVSSTYNMFHLLNLLQFFYVFPIGQSSRVPLWSGFRPWGHWGFFHCCQAMSGLFHQPQAHQLMSALHVSHGLDFHSLVNAVVCKVNGSLCQVFQWSHVLPGALVVWSKKTWWNTFVTDLNAI